MWTTLAEQPLLISIMLGIIVAGLIYGWLQTGYKRVALAAGLTALLIPAAYLLSESIVTDREKILDAVYSTAEAVEQNDHESAVVAISDNEIRQRALNELPRYEFHRLSVRNIEINMVEGSLPPEATVDVDASARVSMVKGGMKNVPVLRRVILTFQKQPDDSWKVTDYTHVSMTGQADNFTPNRTSQ